ncbi:hypothetical protein PROFUN_02586 [Planoprotostelium fungivorum]|uniref:Protein kinase domain-containing protein n=1 Tax=Planoprotostelium fungivorum TaxID=1890364 RepID=A0A2P6MPE9_9EUKA|nr:hypothetical protein PROFUN_02586 [Planoprotostelium fungivorum]
MEVEDSSIAIQPTVPEAENVTVQMDATPIQPETDDRDNVSGSVQTATTEEIVKESGEEQKMDVAPVEDDSDMEIKRQLLDYDEEVQHIDEDEEDTGPLRTKNEITALPPPTKIDIPADAKFELIGTISHMVGDTVIIAGNGGRILDLDSVLCLDDRSFLGSVEDVFGPVAKPFYTIRLYEGQDKDRLIPGVYAHNVVGISKYVDPREIYQKGSDASGNFDEEPREDEIEYSDDEVEAAMKKKKNKKKRDRKRNDLEQIHNSLYGPPSTTPTPSTLPPSVHPSTPSPSVHLSTLPPSVHPSTTVSNDVHTTAGPSTVGFNVSQEQPVHWCTGSLRGVGASTAIIQIIVSSSILSSHLARISGGSASGSIPDRAPLFLTRNSERNRYNQKLTLKASLLELTCGVKALFSAIKTLADVKQTRVNILKPAALRERPTTKEKAEQKESKSDELSPQMAALRRSMDIGERPILNGRYTLISCIGEGAFSILLMAKDNYHPLVSLCVGDDLLNITQAPGDGKMVAIKVLKIGCENIGVEESRRLFSLNKIDSQDSYSLIRIYSTFWTEDRQHFCLSLELLHSTVIQEVRRLILPLKSETQPVSYQVYMDQFTPGKHMKSTRNSDTPKTFGLPEIAKITVQIISCLQMLHAENIIHGDLKPENIIFKHPIRLTSEHIEEHEASFRGMKASTEGPRKKFTSVALKIADFGNAIDRSDSHLYYDNFEVQSLLYRAPEVLFGAPFDTPIDMWSVGCVLWDIYSGGVPLMGSSIRSWYEYTQGTNPYHDIALWTQPDFTITTAQVMDNLFQLLGPPPPDLFVHGKFWSNHHSRHNRTSGPTLKQLLETSNDVYFIDFMTRVLVWNPSSRLKAEEAMRHPFLFHLGRQLTPGSQPLSMYALQMTSLGYPYFEKPTLSLSEYHALYYRLGEEEAVIDMSEGDSLDATQEEISIVDEEERSVKKQKTRDTKETKDKRDRGRKKEEEEEEEEEREEEEQGWKRKKPRATRAEQNTHLSWLSEETKLVYKTRKKNR